MQRTHIRIVNPPKFYESNRDEKSFTVKCDKVFIGEDPDKRINLLDELNRLKNEIELIKDAMGFIPGKKGWEECLLDFGKQQDIQQEQLNQKNL